MSRLVVLTALASLTLVALQSAIASHVRIAGVVVMLVWLWPFAVAMVASQRVAIVVALGVGFLFDVQCATPLGLTMAVNLVVALVMARLVREGIGDFDGVAYWVPSVMAALAGLVAPLMTVIVGFGLLDGTLWRDSVVASMVVNAVAFAVLIRPMAWVGRWVTGVAS